MLFRSTPIQRNTYWQDSKTIHLRIGKGNLCPIKRQCVSQTINSCSPNATITAAAISGDDSPNCLQQLCKTQRKLQANLTRTKSGMRLRIVSKKNNLNGISNNNYYYINNNNNNDDDDNPNNNSIFEAFTCHVNHSDEGHHKCGRNVKFLAQILYV